MVFTAFADDISDIAGFADNDGDGAMGVYAVLGCRNNNSDSVNRCHFTPFRSDRCYATDDLCCIAGFADNDGDGAMGLYAAVGLYAPVGCDNNATFFGNDIVALGYNGCYATKSDNDDFGNRVFDGRYDGNIRQNDNYYAGDDVGDAGHGRCATEM